MRSTWLAETTEQPLYGPALAAEQGFAHWKGLATALSGWTRLPAGDAATAVERIELGLAGLRATGARLTCSHLLGLLAEARSRLGDVSGALAAADEGLGLTEKTLEAMYGPELWRIRGEVLLAAQGARSEEAERSIRRGLELARTLGSPSFALRAALSLAELLRARGAGAEARAVVGPMYAGFTEGLASADLRRAAAVMADA